MKSKLITQALLNYRNNGGTLPLVEAYKIINNMNFAEGGDLPESGLPEKNPTIVDADNNRQGSLLTGMMKARMAIAAQMGNTSAQRMTSVYPNRYEFTGNEQINGENIGVPRGEVGTHFMASMGEFAVPFIQERDNKLQFVSNPKYNDAESMRFESPEDAEYFAEHYKDVAPMMQSFEDGGKIPETIKNPYSFPGRSKDKRPELSVTNAITNTPDLAYNIVKKRTHILGNPIQDPIKYGNKKNNVILKVVNEIFDFPQKVAVYALSGAVEAATNPMQLPVNPFGIKRMYATPSKYINSYFNDNEKLLNPLSSYLIDGIIDPLNFIPYGQYAKPLKIVNKLDNAIDAYDYLNEEAKDRATKLKNKLKE